MLLLLWLELLHVIMQLKADMSGIPRLSSWQAVEPENQLVLPSFSAYPQPYATAAGEYLMLLPQQLEVMMGLQDGDNEEGVDADWIDKVCPSYSRDAWGTMSERRDGHGWSLLNRLHVGVRWSGSIV